MFSENVEYLETGPLIEVEAVDTPDDEIDSSFVDPQPSTSTTININKEQQSSTSMQVSSSSTRAPKKRTAGRVTYSTALNEFAEKWGETQQKLNDDFFKKMKTLEDENAAREDRENERNEAFMMKLMNTFMAGINKQ